MTTPTTRITKLEAVNQMLRAMNEAPINSLTSTLTTTASMAVNTLDDVSREVQQEPWEFNTEYEYPLTRDANNKIPLPSNAFHLDATPYYHYNIDPVIRGDYLYDRKNRTQIFTEDLKCDLRIYIDFEDMPDTARRYITIRATRKWLDQQLGDQALHVYTQEDEAKARSLLIADDLEQGDHNMLTGTHSLYRLAHRRI